jgi:hypothetical protein
MVRFFLLPEDSESNLLVLEAETTRSEATELESDGSGDAKSRLSGGKEDTPTRAKEASGEGENTT